MRYVKKLARPWGPGLIVIILLVALFVFDPSSVAIILGSGAGSLISPILLILVVILGVATRSWWQSVVGMALVTVLNRVFFVRPLGDELPGWDIISGLGTFFVGLLLITLLSGIRDLLLRREATQNV